MRTRKALVVAAILAAVMLLDWLTASVHLTELVAQQPKADPSASGTPKVLPRPDFHFPGNVGRTYLDSDKAQFPRPVQIPKGSPNVVLILLDDAGFGQFSTFGGGVPSPTMDKLAAEGLRYNRFHTTALCSPTRAALITGRFCRHHRRGVKGTQLFPRPGGIFYGSWDLISAQSEPSRSVRNLTFCSDSRAVFR
jgi:arylsulfatase